MSNNAHELSNRLLNALDNSYNVVDMHAVNEIISILEKFNITKELLETTRLGKHVNELRRKTTEPSLARRAKVLVKRWRDLVIPAHTLASPGHTGSNRSSAERQVRRLGGTPLTSPALSRQVVSPAVPSPRPASRPAWGGYESDSQDVILVDDDPPLPPPAVLPVPNTTHKPITPPVKRPPSPEPLHDEKKAKRDKKPKKRRGHSRAGTGTETPALAPGGAVGAAGAGPGAGAGALGTTGAAAGAWSGRNGTHSERRRNGCRRDVVEPYAALVNRMPPVGAKKVKTTKELLEQIQSRSQPAAELAPPGSPDVMLIEPDGEACPIKVDSPLRNGRSSPRVDPPPSPARAASPLPPLEEAREYPECTCGEEEGGAACPAGRARATRPLHVRALHAAYLPGVNGTRAPLHPHRFAVRPAADPHPARAGLFTSVVPLYKYSDYADDACAKNMSRVPLCASMPWTEFAPPPPDPSPPPSPPPPRPYPVDDPVELEVKLEPAPEPDEEAEVDAEPPRPVEAEMVGVPTLEPSERLKAPLLLAEDRPPAEGGADGGGRGSPGEAPAPAQFATDIQDHRTVERTKAEPLDGSALHRLCCDTMSAIPYDYSQMSAAPVVTLPADEAEALLALDEALARARDETVRDELGRPSRPANFAEWHECVRLGELIALPYVVID